MKIEKMQCDRCSVEESLDVAAERWARVEVRALGGSTPPVLGAADLCSTCSGLVRQLLLGQAYAEVSEKGRKGASRG